MSLIKDYKKIGFSKGLISLYSGKLLMDFGMKIFSLFLPIFLYQQFKDINIVIAYFVVTSLGYFLLGAWGARLINHIGIKASLIIATLWRIPYFWAFYNFTDNPWAYLVLAAVSVSMVRTFFWLPFHTESALLTDKKHRGKQMGILFSAASLLSIAAPAVGGFVIANWSFGSLVIMAVIFVVSSIIPFFFLPRTKEEYSWSYIETFKYFFHPYNQRMEIAYMSKGLVDVVQAVFWPIFIFSILDEKFQAVGLITAGVLLVGLILRLFIGGLLDKFHKTKLVKIGIGLNATAWLLKIGVVSALQVFLVSTYHTLALVVLGTSVDTLVYEKAADRGHYADEYTMIKEMAINLGRVLGLMFIAVLLLFLPLQVSFFVAAFIVLFISWLK